ncbi:MAG: signal peptide peptidase SppA, partial [Thermodesulfovibrionia bacterium]|nr:signal peptide peptidase SppA [Thermodesulfovibrionia bacterium]
MKKFLFFSLIVLILIAILSYALTFTQKIAIGEKVGLIRVEGVILDSTHIIDEIKKYSEDSSIKAVVLRVNSPGGAVAPAQEIYKEIIKLKKLKKVVVSLGA